MDEQRFDDLSKKLATSVSRRQAVKILGATTLAGVGALFGARGAYAHQCRDIGSTCRSNAECCDRMCVDFHCVCPGGSVLCPSSNQCLPECGGARTFNPTTCECECPAGLSPCGDFECCAPDQACCGQSQGFGFCCPPQWECCEEFFGSCCPPGTQCSPQGCVSLCNNQLCNFTSQCPQGCTCVGATIFTPGHCQ